MNSKSLFYLMVCIVFLQSCNPTAETPTSTPTDRISLAKTLTIPATVMVDSVLKVPFTANKEWSFSDKGQDWLSFKDTTGTNRRDTLCITVLSLNTTGSPRQFKVNMTAGSAKSTLTITQEPFVFSAVPNSVVLDYRQGSKDTLQLLTTGDWEITQVLSEEELALSPLFTVSPSSGTGLSVTPISITTNGANITDDDYVAQFKVTSGTLVPVYFTVTQKHQGSLTLSRKTFEPSTAGESITITVSANTDYSVSIPKGDTWISRVTTKAKENTEELFEIAEASEDGDREGMIVFSTADMSDTVKVFQKQLDRLILTTSTLSVPDEGGTYQVSLRTNVEYSIAIPDSVSSWISLQESSTKVMNTYERSFVVAANTNIEKARNAVVIFKDVNSILTDTLKISQSKKAVMELSPLTINLYEEPDATLELQTNVAYTTVIPSNALWITIASDTQSGSGRAIKLSFAANPNFSQRQATVTIKETDGTLEQSITITQAPYAQQAFVKATQYGFYNDGTAVFVYRPGTDQYAWTTSTTSHAFRVQNYDDKKLVNVEVLSTTMAEGNSYDATVSSIGLTSEPTSLSPSLLVLRKKDNKLWLMNTSNREGYIMYQ